MIFNQVACDDNELENCFKGADFPLIVKPISGSASRSLIAIKNSEQAREMFTDAHRNPIEYPVVVETFIVGEELSVEGFSNGGGKHRFWGITCKKRSADSFVESGHEFPARLEKELADRILD
jgi:biotin carboxylase